MTINERVSPETLDKIIEAADEVIRALAGTNEDVHKNDSAKMCQLWDDLNDRYATPAIVKALAAELQQYRAAAKKPIGSFHIIDQQVDGTTDYVKDGEWPIDNGELLVYAAPQVTSVPEELLSAMEDVLRISDRDHDAWNRAKYAIAAIRSAPAVQAEQEPVSQPYTLPEPITRNDADGWRMYKGRRVGGGCAEWYNRALDDCRAAIASGNSPAIPEGYALVPSKLTADNGAKGALSGEFSETKFISCPECFGDDECETCDGSGRIEITVPVSWTTIKEIWAKGVEHFAAAPKQEAE